MDELKPCPFCGSGATCIDDYCEGWETYYTVQCDNGKCMIDIGWHETPEEAIAMWDQRVDSICGIKTTINFSGDLKVEGYWKKWTTEDEFTCIKYTRSGLVYLTDPDGKNVTVPKRNCNALK